MSMLRRLSIPRSAWSSHPHWPTQTLLLGSHDSFRQISRQLITQTAADDHVDWVALVYPQWIWGMRRHEAYEEHKLYPYLTRRWGIDFDHARQGHQQLHEADDAVRRALEQWNRDGHRSALLAALQEHDRVLDEHLEHEETRVIPALLELTPQQFEDYRSRSLPELMRQLDEAEGPPERLPGSA
ncbi:MAG: hemerythrin domain-containing protein [Myxococcota bacterium]